MNLTDLERILPLVRSFTAESSRIAGAGYRKHPAAEHKGAVDLVTAFDRASEANLRTRLLATFDFDIVGEEEGGSWSRDRPTFFIDPIDGTTNFVHGHPFWCVSVGLVVAGQPCLGVVVAPMLGLEWFGYLTPQGERFAKRRSTLNAAAIEETCAVSAVQLLDQSLLGTGFPYDRKTSKDNNFDAFLAMQHKAQAVRRCGSAAIDLCLVADGTYDGYWERKVKPWDIAAGAAIARAAGGTVSDFEGHDAWLETGRIAATNGLIHNELVSALGSVSAVTQAL